MLGDASVAKTAAGPFFEDFRLGETIRHATPRTLTSGDASLYSALYGARFAPQSAETFARAIGYPASPIDDLLAFHVVFGKTVPDVSLNAVANLGYADCRFLKPVFPGDTLSAVSRGDRAQGELQQAERRRLRALARLQPARRDGDRLCALGDGAQARRGRAGARGSRSRNSPRRSAPPTSARPARESIARRSTRAQRLAASVRGLCAGRADRSCRRRSRSKRPSTMTATRLYQNTAKVHFNQFSEGQGRFGRRLIYGGHVISLARALSFNGLANAFHIAAINGGRHVAPLFAGDTVFAWSEIVETAACPAATMSAL